MIKFKSFPIDVANAITETMEIVKNTTSPVSATESTAFFMLLDLKQTLLDEEYYEVLQEFKLLEDMNECPIPFNA